jgi:hypothetical protein
LSIAAAFIVGEGAFFVPREAAFFVPREAAFFALTGDRFFLLAVFALGFLAALRLLLEGLRARFFEALFCFFEPLPRAFFFFVAILICSLFVRRA